MFYPDVLVEHVLSTVLQGCFPGSGVTLLRGGLSLFAVQNLCSHRVAATPVLLVFAGKGGVRRECPSAE